ncbi:hypothetical protein F53441_4252 [Fusarium austroafricanum]|uniref:Uncharacterized protein n=1 Tax=Fusarium austroafricanum TaxID=2364996 RepID=A0A8H4KMF4_9HYPO|nr:hypothetical protein F53441_4252 [Fusarium austroafricanum]
MAGIVETAYLQLKAGIDEQKLRDITKATLPIQAQWIREHQPKLLEGKPYDHTTDIWISEDETPCLFLTAPWDSVDGHIEWIKSQENVSLMQEFKEFISDDHDAVVLNHLESAGENEFRGDIMVRGLVKVWKISVKPEERASLEKEYREIETQSSALPGQTMWAGWKVEGDGTEMVIISSPGFEDVIESGIAVRFEDTKVSRFGYKPFLH